MEGLGWWREFWLRSESDLMEKFIEVWPRVLVEKLKKSLGGLRVENFWRVPWWFVESSILVKLIVLRDCVSPTFFSIRKAIRPDFIWRSNLADSIARRRLTAERLNGIASRWKFNRPVQRRFRLWTSELRMQWHSISGYKHSNYRISKIKQKLK